ncbi:hypothetical protein LY78DRAFT_741908 [Colletotrichum sublineola]|nr:hypothetical protein LY78DRAFT_741908 [Colletotrichum sublineola]
MTGHGKGASDTIIRICTAYNRLLSYTLTANPPTLYEYLCLTNCAPPAEVPCSAHDVYLALESIIIKHTSSEPGDYSDAAAVNEKARQRKQQQEAAANSRGQEGLGDASDKKANRDEKGSRDEAAIWAKVHGIFWLLISLLAGIRHLPSPCLRIRRRILWTLIVICVIVCTIISVGEATCDLLLSNPPSFFLASMLTSLAFSTLCTRRSAASVHGVSLQVSRTPILPRYGESLTQMAAWAAHGAGYAPPGPSDALRIADFEFSLRAIFDSITGSQRDASNIAQDIQSYPADRVRWWSFFNTPAATTQDRISRLVVVFEDASRTLNALESSLPASAIERTFKPIKATCDWSRKLYKEERALRKELRYIGGNPDQEKTVQRALEAQAPRGAIARVACHVTEIETEQLLILRGDLRRKAVPRMASLLKSSLELATDGESKGRQATGEDVVWWEKRVVQLAKDFDEMVSEVCKGWVMNEVQSAAQH